MLKNVARSLSLLSGHHLCANSLTKRFAGHSKWQNIRHIKGAKDALKSKIFTKLSRQIRVAVQEGGSIDPSKNSKLEQVIEQTRRANMPAATLQSMLKSCQQDKTQSKSHILEIKGPGSCFILCEVFTPQLQQLKMSIATILKKHQSKFGDGGGMYFFEEKGIIEALPQGQNTNKEALLEAATEHAIESGAEDVTIIEENVLQFVCGASNMSKVVKGLEQLNYEVASASVEYIPLKTQDLDEKDLQLYERLYEKLEALPEVVKISDNVA